MGILREMAPSNRNAAPAAASSDRPAAQTSTGQSALGAVLSGHHSLADLLKRQRESSQRLAALREALGHPLLREVQAGPLDDAQWVLLAPNSAVASKLKHLLPELSTSLAAGGWPARQLKVHVLKHRV